MADPHATDDLRLVMKTSHTANGEGEIDANEGDEGTLLSHALVTRQGSKWVHVRLDGSDSDGLVPHDTCLLAHNYPFINASDIKYRAQARHEIHLYPGDRGVVVQLHASVGELDWADVVVTARGNKEERQGFVPLPLIAIGNTRKYGDVKTPDTPLETMDDDEDSQESGLDDSLVFKAVLATLETFRIHKDGDLAFLLPEANQFIKTVRICKNTAAIIVQGFKDANTYNTLNKSGFTLVDIEKDASGIANLTDHTAGVYLRRYSGFKTSQKTYLYGGSSHDIPNRMREHAKKLKGREGTHANIYNNSSEREYRVFCLLIEQPNIYAYIAEQVTLLLLGLYSHDIGAWFQRGRVSNDVSEDDVATEIEMHENTTVFENEAEEAKKGKSRGKSWLHLYTMFAQHADLLRTKVEPELNKVGWTPATHTPHFAATFSRVEGINMTSPLAQFYSKNAYTRIKKQDTTVYFRRAPFSTINVGKSSNRVGALGGSDPLKAYFNAKRTKSPPAGTMVWLRFEVTNDGSAHPHVWTRLPSVMIWSDAARAMSLGVEAIWMEVDGAWKSMWLESGHDIFYTRDFDPAVEGCFNSLGAAISILNCLERLEVPEDYLRPFDVPFSPIRLFNVGFDFLNQTVVVEEDFTPARVIRNGEKRPIDDITQELHDAGAHRVGGIPPENVRCDTCHLAARGRVNKLKVTVAEFRNFDSECKPSSDGFDACAICKLAGRPCTFTNNKLVNKNLTLQEALWPPKDDRYEPTEIDKPVIYGPRLAQLDNLGNVIEDIDHED